MASPVEGQQQACALQTDDDVPDRCLLFSDKRIEEQFQELVPIQNNKILKIGRDPDSSFCLQDDEDNLASRKHCEIYVVEYDHSDSVVYVRDRGSINGTYINGDRIGVRSKVSSGHLLKHGDVITIIPHWQFTFCDKRPQKEHALTEIQQAECELFEDRYSISQRCLGQGADGVVYLATEKETKKQLVCKVVNLKSPRTTKRQGELRRKLQESDVLRQLQHPNIVPYVDAIISPHSLYTFTELATGGDLWSFIYRHGPEEPINEYETRVITRQVVRGLQYLHTKGVIHRDLKPENILLAYSPKINCHRVMLSDFGAYAVPSRSRMVTRAGTPNYQAPEIRAGAESQTAAVDIWSLGIVVQTMLTHHLDSVSDGADESEHEYLNDKLADRGIKLSPYCRHFVRRCLQAVPSSRMSAMEAQCHDWLCKSERLCKRFRELDRRTMANWKPPTQLKPMPLQLPDVMIEVAASDDDDEVTRSSHGRQVSELMDEHSQYFPGTGTSLANAETEPCQDIEPTDVLPDSRMNSMLTETNQIDVIKGTPPEETPSENAQATRGGPNPVAKRVTGSKVRVQDSSRLPVANWKRRLDIGTTGANRTARKEQMLGATARRGVTKFMSNKAPSAAAGTASGGAVERGPVAEKRASPLGANSPTRFHKTTVTNQRQGESTNVTLLQDDIGTCNDTSARTLL